MTNVTFKNSKFVGTDFDKSRLVNVKFINSDFLSSDFFKIIQSKIEFQDTNFERVTFDKAQATFSFSGAKFINTDFTSLNVPSSLSFTKSEMDVDFSRSKIDKLEITDSISRRAGGSDLRIKELTMKDNKGDRINFGDSTIDRITVENADMTDQIIGIVRSSVKDLFIVNSIGGVAAIKATIGKIKILNSPSIMIDVDEATADSIYISNSTIKEGFFEKFKAKKLEFENVTLDGEMNFKNAQVDQFIDKNTTQTPKAVIDLTGSNIKF